METCLRASQRTPARRAAARRGAAAVRVTPGVTEPISERTTRDDAISREHATSVLRGVLERGAFRLRCQRMQPVHGAGEVRPKYEVLLTVLHAGRRRLSPQRFVLAAERCGCMSIIDEWVLRSTLSWMSAHRNAMSSVAGLSINLSGQSLDNPRLADQIAAELDRARVPASWLTFEITETAPLSNLGRAATTVRAIQSLGARVCVDDFGCGYAGELYVRTLKPDMVKFETKLLHTAGSVAIGSGIAGWIRHYCQQNGILTVAECVDDRASLPMLRALGVDYAQGFAIETPFWLDALS